MLQVAACKKIPAFPEPSLQCVSFRAVSVFHQITQEKLSLPRLGKKMNSSLLCFLYPHLEYCIQLWSPHIRRTWMPWSRSRGGPWRWPEGWSISKNQALNQKLNQKLRPTSANLSSELNKQPELLNTTDRFKPGLGDWMTKSLLYPRSLVFLTCEPDSGDGELGRQGWLGARERNWNTRRGFIMHFLYNSQNILLFFLINPRESTTEVWRTV